VLNNETNEEEIIETDGIFVAIGHTPNTVFLNGQVDTDETGYINVIPGTTETNISIRKSQYKSFILELFF
jgi:thioredoxin reductase (NADPH)